MELSNANRDISIVIPVYNGASSIANLVSAIQNELQHLDIEFVLINDCSPDNSAQVCNQIAISNPNVNFISLRKNFGEHNAVMCGLNFAKGKYITIIDDDFQNPPSEIIKLYDEARKGFDVVYSRYEKKKHSFFRNIGSRINGSLSTWLLEKPKSLYLSSFKIIEYSLVQEIIKYRGPYPYIDGLILRATKSIGTVTVDHQPRKEGKSNYTIKKLVKLCMNMFFNFSVKPLRIFTTLGFVAFCFGIIFSVVFALEYFFLQKPPSGWPSLIISIFIFSGTQLMFMGLIGEYVGKLYLDINKTPQWSIDTSIPSKDYKNDK